MLEVSEKSLSEFIGFPLVLHVESKEKVVTDSGEDEDEICADNYNYSRFKLKGRCRSEKWEVYLFGDKNHQGVLPVHVEGQVSQ